VRLAFVSGNLRADQNFNKAQTVKLLVSRPLFSLSKIAKGIDWQIGIGTPEQVAELLTGQGNFAPSWVT
jgi:hypothetical protein